VRAEVKGPPPLPRAYSRWRESPALEMDSQPTGARDQAPVPSGASSTLGQQSGRAEEQRLRAILETAQDAIVIADASGRIIDFNRAATRMFGRTSDEVLGEPLTILMPERFHAAHGAGLQRYLDTREPRVIGDTVELAARRANGAEFPIELSLASFEHDGETFFTGILSDISERKRAEEALRESQSKLIRSQQIARLGSWEWDIAADEVTWSDELHRLYGTSPDGFEASYEAFLERVHPADRPTVEAAITSALESGEPFEFDHRIVPPDGDVLVLHAEGQVVMDQEGNPIRMIGTGQDVTDRRRAEEVDRRLAAILAQSEDAIIAKDTEGVVTEWNKGAERLYGYSADEAIGKSISMLIPRDRAGEEWALLASVLEGRPIERYETFRLHKSGRRLAIWATISPVRDSSGAIVGAASIARDMTELKRTQLELERSNAELEQFAYITSHDLQEPLRSVTGFVQLLERRYRGELDDDADRFIGFIVDGVDRMQVLINDVLAYAGVGRAELRREPVDTHVTVERALALVQSAVAETSAEVDVGDLPTVDADSRSLVQLFQNLLSNAVKFTDGRRPRVEISARRRKGEWRFAVADNGIGIDGAHAERIFRMFQRLHPREQYGGTGIGLAICSRIVERHGGRIWCEPRTGGGTVFRFTIPDESEVMDGL
jgi:PAS domain S-box-containing protein